MKKGKPLLNILVEFGKLSKRQKLIEDNIIKLGDKIKKGR